MRRAALTAKQGEILAENMQRHRFAGRQAVADVDRLPEAAQERAGRGTGPDGSRVRIGPEVARSKSCIVMCDVQPLATFDPPRIVAVAEIGHVAGQSRLQVRWP